MKTNAKNLRSFSPASALAVLLLVVGVVCPRPASAQEENLKAAMSMKDQRKEGISDLGDRVQNFFVLKFARKLVEKLESRDREVDPFGMAMDPEQELADIVVQSVDEETEEEKVKTSLEEALSKFQVTGIFPGRKEIMIGAQTLRVGDRLLIKHQGAVFHLAIAGIDSKKVSLQDTETGEHASVPHGVLGGLPPGMHREKPVLASGEALSETGTIVPMSDRLITLE